MKLPKFTSDMKKNYPDAPWLGDMGPDDFISYATSYVMGDYWNEFEKCTLPCETTGDVTYYLYDPIKHGASPDKRYPVLTWIHGLNCSIDGIKCVGYCGAEQYASAKYQEQMGGGAYLIVPLANEERLEDNTIIGSWSEDYIEPLKAICDKVTKEHQANISARFIMGASSGGYMTWRMLEEYPELFEGGIPIASGYVPTDESLKNIEAHNVNLIIAHAIHDEMALFKEAIEPREDFLHTLKNCICYFPEWVRNEDKGISSVNYGFEMGQHCFINQFQANLIYNDGTCYDERIPNGVTGWVKQVNEQVK